FEQLTSSFFANSRSRVPALQASRSDEGLTLRVDLPGVPAEAVAVEVSDRTLTMKADHEGSTWAHSLSLGSDLDLENITARHVDGRLTVTIGAVPTPAPRRIEIATSPAGAIAASSDAGEASSDAGEASVDQPAGDDAPSAG